MSTNWTDALVRVRDSIRDAMQRIDESGLQIALVTDENRVLKGVVTDGDIRRAILSGVSLDDPVKRVMNDDPATIPSWKDRDETLALMRSEQIHQLPIVDDEGRIVGLEVLDDLLQPERRDNPVVIMAGGLGTRLRPLTEDTPKPLLEVGDRPILETILQQLVDSGFHQFYLSVNYKADMIERYFEDGSDWDIDITYIHEEERLGTAGPLSQLPKRPDKPFFVMNGDLLTKLDFSRVMDFHEEREGAATMCVRKYDFQVPYGVIETEGHRIAGLDEKPVQRFFVNAGIYVLDPSTLGLIPDGEFFDMTELFNALVDRGERAHVFPIREYWQDVGRMEDYKQASQEYDEVFRTSEEEIHT